MNRLPFLQLLFTLLIFNTLHSFAQTSPKRELRGVWVATVNNIDWPSAKGMTTGAQKHHFSWLLDEYQKDGLNAVFVQVRPAADAFYFSKYEPWSEWLTGRQGKAPSPFYDPLEFMVSEAHDRGLEFHAWFNPYRAVSGLKTREKHPMHISQTHPEWLVRYGNKYYLNPGLAAVQMYITKIVADVVERYDIDGVHFDDYFYPYHEEGQYFNDDNAFLLYPRGFRNKADWRRNNVTRLIRLVNSEIKKRKAYVKFGVSPFGVWRNAEVDPAGSETKASASCYDELFSDTRLWLSKGYVDYLAPQIYFAKKNPYVPYEILTDWWRKNTFGRHIYVGHAVYKADRKKDPNWTNTSQLPDQIRYNRDGERIAGSIHFSSRSLSRNFAGFRDSLRTNLYRYPALVPAMPWLDNKAPDPPRNLAVFSVKSGALLFWEPPLSENKAQVPTYYIIYRFKKGAPIDPKDPRNIVGLHRAERGVYVDRTTETPGLYLYAVSSADRLHNESRICQPAGVEMGMINPFPLSKKEPAPTAAKTEKSAPKEKYDWRNFMKVVWKLYLKNDFNYLIIR